MSIIVEHLLYADVFLKDAPLLVDIYDNDDLLETFGWYVLTEYQFVSGLIYRSGDIVFRQDLRIVNIRAVVRDAQDEYFEYGYNENMYTFYGHILKKYKYGNNRF